MRWKIYQVSPVGPRKESILNSDLLITHEQFMTAIMLTKLHNSDFKIEAQPFINSFGRYCHIFPDGKCHITEKGDDELPTEILMGNIVQDFDYVLDNINHSFNFDHNSKHGKS